MVKSGKIKITQIISEATVEVESDVNYWQLTKKGVAMAANLAEAYKHPKNEINKLIQKLKAMT